MTSAAPPSRQTAGRLEKEQNERKEQKERKLFKNKKQKLFFSVSYRQRGFQTFRGSQLMAFRSRSCSALPWPGPSLRCQLAATWRRPLLARNEGRKPSEKEKEKKKRRKRLTDDFPARLCLLDGLLFLVSRGWQVIKKNSMFWQAMVNREGMI